jgi:hypothetical protein
VMSSNLLGFPNFPRWRSDWSAAFDPPSAI